MSALPTFDREVLFDPAADFEAFIKQAPAKWAVYLFADAEDRPLQLLCVKNLRYSLKRRLQGETISPRGGWGRCFILLV